MEFLFTMVTFLRPFLVFKFNVLVPSMPVPEPFVTMRADSFEIGIFFLLFLDKLFSSFWIKLKPILHTKFAVVVEIQMVTVMVYNISIALLTFSWYT